MRFTIPSPTRPGRHLDVEVEPGLPVGSLRRHLALLTGDPRWAAPHGVLEVGGQVLDARHPAGAPPLVPGTHLAHGPASNDDATAAARADLHVAVLTGPATGRVVPLPERCRTTFAPGGPPEPDRRGRDGRPGRLAVEIRRRGAHVRVRVRGTRGAALYVDRASAARPGRRGARVRVVGRLPRRWPVGAELRVPGATLELRAREDGTGRPRRGRRPPAWAWSAVATTSVAVVLAVALRQPLLLLTAVTGTVGLLALRSSARRADPGPEPTDAPPTATRRETVRDVAALRVATARGLQDRTGPVPGDDTLWPSDPTLALVGPRSEVLAAARALVLRTLGAGTGRRLVLRTPRPDDWRWTRWWQPTTELPDADDADVLVVCDGTDEHVAAWRLAAPRTPLLLAVAPGGAPPAWAAEVIATGGPTGRPPSARTGTRPRRGDRAAPVERVPAAVADAQGRAAAAVGWVSAADPGRTAPRAVHALGALPGVPAARADDVAAAWDRARDLGTLQTPLGVGADGSALVLDLVRDGPHALVAGTTGSGKSELLTTLVLAAALSRPPHRLALLLVDFKGGTGLGPLAGLPHVVDHVHDLDVAAAHRLLVGLRAELRRRERYLAAAGATDVADLDPDDPACPGRLLVVVDELRALVDDLPSAAATLARLAAQGRALGVHLVLATQRPAGAVAPDLRANIGLRIALRVADEDDSRDVVGCPDAARIDVASPGRALVRVGARPPVVLHVARARQRRTSPPVRIVPAVAPPSAGWCAQQPPSQDVADWVAACRQAAAGRPAPSVPWSPALPTHLVAPGPGDTSGLLVAVADVPDEQRRTDVLWRPGRGPLLVLGGPGSGRSTTLGTVGAHALLAGAHVHTLGAPDDVVARLRATSAAGLGTTLGPDDLHRTLLLLHRLSARRGAGPTVLLVDGLDELLDMLLAHARGVGAELLTRLLRRPPTGVHVAASGPVVPAVTRLAGTFGTRLVLPVPDASLDLQAGVPQELAGHRGTPGRAVVCAPDGSLLCQVVLPARPARPVDDVPGGGCPSPSGAGPLRIGELPDRSYARRGGSRPPADVVPPGGAAALRIPLGTGGDAPGPVAVEPSRPLLVAGSAGSGRTTALRTVAAGWAATGARVVLVTSAPPTCPEGHVPAPGAVTVVPPEAVGALLDGLGDGPDVGGRARPTDAAGGLSAPTPTGGPDTVVLLLDDVDQLERQAPLLAERLDRLVRRPDVGLRVVAVATTTDHATVAHRGPVAAVLRTRLVLVLDPHGPAAQDLLGPGAAFHTDPAQRPPGRGVLRDDRVLVRVQVHLDDGSHRARVS